MGRAPGRAASRTSLTIRWRRGRKGAGSERARRHCRRVARQQRARYSNYVKDQVRQRYPLCRTTADKEHLAKELGIGSVAKLYNLASRLGATGKEGAERHSMAAANEEERLLIRERPESTVFTPEADRYLESEFGRRSAATIAFHLHHTETAVLYRARQLGLRLPVKYWDIVKVAFWFGMEVDEFRALADEGLDIYPFHDPRTGRLVKEVVSTTSLARWLAAPENIKRLQYRDADEFFIREIQESVRDKAAKKTDFERCKFLSHDHICMNTYSENSFGLYCTNTDRQRAGEDPRCSVRHLDIDDLRPDNQHNW